MIDLRTLLITLGILLCILALTTVAAIANKIYSNREEDSKRDFLDHLRKQFLLLKTGIEEDREDAMRSIVRAMLGHWSEIAAEEVSQLELPLRLDVSQAF